MTRSRPKTSRRQFLKAAATSAAPLIVPASALGRSRLAPSERVTVGLVGCGERGMQVVSDFLKDSRVQITAVCDVHDRHYRERKWGQGKNLAANQPDARLKSTTCRRPTAAHIAAAWH